MGRPGARTSITTITLPAEAITGLILASGRGARLGGIDKGLREFNRMPLTLRTLLPLNPQVGETMISVNRKLEAYESFGAPVWPDSTALGEYADPLAGFITGLQR